jgi:hypothetical protein
VNGTETPGRDKRPAADVSQAAPPEPIPGLERDPARAREVAALVRLADLDRLALAPDGRRRRLDADGAAGERNGLVARLSPEIHEAYDRALRAGRQPAVVCLVKSVCSGCHVRLHATLEQKVRRRRGVAACPHCLRLVYDPAWLTA